MVHGLHMVPLLESALDLARRGWPVFPCNPAASGRGGKQPLVGTDKDANGGAIPKTGGLYKATRDPEMIRRWWTKWPEALIGVRMGRDAGVFAIDLDVPKREGDADGRSAWQE